MKVLFVCVGNACRSPMAEALFNFECRNRNNGCEAKSAGLRPYAHVIDGSVRVMSEFGIDISKHKPKGLSLEVVEWADKIILLDRDIRDDVVKSSASDENDLLIWHVEDPYGTSIQNFRRVRDTIHGKILNLLNVTS